MSLSSSLNAGVSGLATNSSRLATISDNISNSSTFGYKKGETEFHSLVIAGTYTAGGVRSTVERNVDAKGTLISTGNATDLAVAGRGFLPVASRTDVVSGGDFQMQMTSTGSFKLDQNGYLRSPSDLLLLGCAWIFRATCFRALPHFWPGPMKCARCAPFAIAGAKPRWLCARTHRAMSSPRATRFRSAATRPMSRSAAVTGARLSATARPRWAAVCRPGTLPDCPRPYGPSPSALREWRCPDAAAS